MLLGPDEVARRMQYERGPWWWVWYGHQTLEYWAVARWVRVSWLLSAATPAALEAAIVAFETRYPRPGLEGEHGVGG